MVDGSKIGFSNPLKAPKGESCALGCGFGVLGFSLLAPLPLPLKGNPALRFSELGRSSLQGLRVAGRYFAFL